MQLASKGKIMFQNLVPCLNSFQIQGRWYYWDYVCSALYVESCNLFFILLHASYNISWSVVGGMYIINNIIFAYFTLQQIQGLFQETLASFCSYGTTLSSSLQMLHFP